jgi:hypothetical protein
MDPIAVLLSALSLAGTAARPVTDQAVKDGYTALKALVLRKFGAIQPKLEGTLGDYAEDPDTYTKPTEKLLQQAGVDRDAEVLEQAATLLQRAGGCQVGFITVTARGKGNIAVGGTVSGSTIITGGQTTAHKDR